MGTATIFHRSDWRLEGTQGDFHEFSHTLLEMLGFKNPQGDWGAEAFVLAIEAMLDKAAGKKDASGLTLLEGATWSKEWLASTVRTLAGVTAGRENLVRSLSYLLCQELPDDQRRTPREYWQEVLFSEAVLVKEAKRLGWVVEYDNTGMSTDWSITMLDGNRYKCENESIGTAVLPEGVEKYTVPHDVEIHEVFEKIDPAMQILFSKLGTPLGQKHGVLVANMVTVGELIDAADGPRPALPASTPPTPPPPPKPPGG